MEIPRLISLNFINACMMQADRGLWFAMEAGIMGEWCELLVSRVPRNAIFINNLCGAVRGWRSMCGSNSNLTCVRVGYILFVYVKAFSLCTFCISRDNPILNEYL